ncbi:hypothetical protein P152DRAFT_51428 [Eremomyces bilateralis CBS 781.70]|uniref:Uncharacterized protein n=1 Tax=Eremomyces bilateralis CBS 781.70 TaxID=1392243 RepID=A0A6G1G196_9PEZI|nr:uncharacterized protein P152DRAFT_51428 [Eremomyces bilateralis CBS 781.70]KAF1811788.1 hypothetical protein P152DRAFT_51428 [Eremomyces bilateralis CBS 781.70]
MTTEPPPTPYGAKTPSDDPYSYPRSSVLATRALLSEPSSTAEQNIPSLSNPRSTPDTSSSGIIPSSGARDPLTVLTTQRNEGHNGAPDTDKAPGVNGPPSADPWPDSTRPPLPKRTSWNYEIAVAERVASSPKTPKSAVSGGGGYFQAVAERAGGAIPERGKYADEGGGEGRDREPGVGRRMSWAEQDRRREMMVAVMESPGAGSSEEKAGMEWGYESCGE